MRRIIFIAAAGLGLAGCGSLSLPGTDLFRSAPPEAPLKLESTPPGADARTSVGPACKTPCVVNVPADKNFTVTFTLDKHQPQTVPVQVIPGSNDPGGDAGLGQQPPSFDPSPVYVEMQPTVPSRRTTTPKKKPAAKPKAAGPAGSPFPEPAPSAFPSPPAQR
jgi:hypothetical protein